MTGQFTDAEIAALLRGQGVPDSLIAKRHQDGTPRQEVTTKAAPIFPPRVELPPAPAIQWPLRLTLPWSCLVSDNARYSVTHGRMHLTTEYRAARKAVVARARDVMQGAAPVAIPLRLEARVWVPDRRLHDCANFAKGAADAMQKVVYQSDRWLYRVMWERAGVDCDAPRAELTITPIPPP